MDQGYAPATIKQAAAAIGAEGTTADCATRRCCAR